MVEDGRRLLSNAVASSVDLHAAYGGVVPEIAARSHVEVILPTIEKALQEADASWPDIDAIAVTEGPGLAGSLLIGVMTARSLAIARRKPLYAVNHVTAHVYAAFLTESALPDYRLSPAPPLFPLLALIVSGGHTQLALFSGHHHYRLLGQTLDDAVGEAFDKVAKILGLPYPGGPSVSAAARGGNPAAVALPQPKLSGRYDFSYSGLKTAVLRAAQELCGKTYDFPSIQLAGLLSAAQKNDLAASFQAAAIAQLAGRTVEAAREFRPKTVVVAGGVAANDHLRSQMEASLDTPLLIPDVKLCTDNAAMVASLGYFLAAAKRPSADAYSLTPSPDLNM